MIPISRPVIGDEERRAVLEVLGTGMLAQGARVQALEEGFARLCGTEHAVAVNSGTAALHAALRAAGVGPGDEVVTTPFTFVATANAAVMLGARVVFADVDEVTFNLSPAEVARRLTPRTKAIVGVDLYGRPADWPALRAAAGDRGIALVEDACQAHAAELGGVRAGALGDIGCFSLYATKNMTCGEGGMVTTDDAAVAESCRRFRHHGQGERYEYLELGYNYRLTDLAAAIAIAQLGRLEELTRRRIANAALLTRGLRGVEGVRTPTVSPGSRHVFHQYTIVCEGVDRDGLVAHLKEAGVQAGVYYPKPLHLHPHFARMGYRPGDFPVSERLAARVASLPVHPSLSREELAAVVAAVRGYAGR